MAPSKGAARRIIYWGVQHHFSCRYSVIFSCWNFGLTSPRFLAAIASHKYILRKYYSFGAIGQVLRTKRLQVQLSNAEQWGRFSVLTVFIVVCWKSQCDLQLCFVQNISPWFCFRAFRKQYFVTIKVSNSHSLLSEWTLAFNGLTFPLWRKSW